MIHVCGIAIFIALYALPLLANDKNGLSKGQTTYVPAYSYFYSGNREVPFFLTVMVSIRNIDPKYKIRIMPADYFETQGQLLKKYVKVSAVLNPLESLRYVVPEYHKAGGSGANFLVEWESDNYVNPPIVDPL